MDIDVLVVVLAGGEGKRLWPLTAERCKPAVPFGGKYRLVDLPLSNAFNSGLRNIYVLTQGKDKSFIDHLKNAWHIDPIDGYVTTISPQEAGGQYLGDADAVRHITKYIQRSHPDVVLVVPGDNVVKMDYRAFAEFFEKRKDAQAAVSIVEMPLDRAKDLGSVAIDPIDPDPWVSAFREKDPNTPLRASDNKHFFASMGTYAFRTDVLLDVLKQTSGKKFGDNIMPDLQKSGKLLGYNFSKNNEIPGYQFDYRTCLEEHCNKTPDSGYWEDVGKIKQYHAVHMDLVGVTPLFNIHSPSYPEHYRNTKKWWPLRTSVEIGSGPSKSTRGSEPTDSIISEAVIFSGARVNRCILSPHVQIEDSNLENVVVFEGAFIKGCKIRNAIIDKNARLTGLVIGYGGEPDPVIYADPESGIHIIPRNFGRGDFNRELYLHKPE